MKNKLFEKYFVFSPYFWLVLFFFIPLAIIFKISISVSEWGMPPYQDIFLFDSTIAENIAFTNDHSLIDFQKLEEVCKISELTDFIDNLKDGIFSMIGERGVKISGGQIQRK